jgi:diamine N-acetyltransferase
MGTPGPDDETRRVSLRDVTGGNLKAILALRVADEQKTVYPRSNAYSIAEGHHPPDDDPVWMRAIYAGDRPVGFLMTSEVPERGEYFLWRLMIDAEFQGLGYGSRAVDLLIERIEATPNASVLLTSHVDGDGDAGVFYRKLGFEYTGETLGECDRAMKMAMPRR